ncbi:methyltransferase domain-containing protein [Geodermatophilus sp. CPCC 206100]|uniref:class I SAM-dependent methyltransferase n=1 Tax=Geodermatophilus sp. CPCC 206100 TaxID=3020054 RepID=UPI003AFF9076
MNARTHELERIAHSYHLNDDVPDKFIEDALQEHCCDWLAGLVSPDDVVVELGVGEGVTLSRLASLPRRYVVVEGAPSLAARVRAQHPTVEVAEALFEEFVPDEPCDKLMALHVLEHVDDPVALAAHLRTWLVPDGELVVVVPNRRSLHRRLAVLMGLQPELDTLSPRDHLVGHQRVYDLDSLEADLRAAGFEPFERKGMLFKPLPNAMMLDFSPQLVQALNDLGDELPADLGANIAVRARRAR